MKPQQLLKLLLKDQLHNFLTQHKLSHWCFDEMTKLENWLKNDKTELGVHILKKDRYLTMGPHLSTAIENIRDKFDSWLTHVANKKRKQPLVLFPGKMIHCLLKVYIKAKELQSATVHSPSKKTMPFSELKGWFCTDRAPSDNYLSNLVDNKLGMFIAKDILGQKSGLQSHFVLMGSFLQYFFKGKSSPRSSSAHDDLEERKTQRELRAIEEDLTLPFEESLDRLDASDGEIPLSPSDFEVDLDGVPLDDPPADHHDVTGPATTFDLPTTPKPPALKDLAVTPTPKKEPTYYEMLIKVHNGFNEHFKQYPPKRKWEEELKQITKKRNIAGTAVTKLKEVQQMTEDNFFQSPITKYEQVYNDTSARIATIKSQIKECDAKHEQVQKCLPLLKKIADTMVPTRIFPLTI